MRNQLDLLTGQTKAALAAQQLSAQLQVLLAGLAVLFLSGVASGQNPLVDAGLVDPGYANVSQRDDVDSIFVIDPETGEQTDTFTRPGIYLGNQWFLTTNHGGDPAAVRLNGQVFNVIPNQSVVLDNPTNELVDFVFPEPSSQSPNLLERSDLQLFRIGLNSDQQTPEQANAAVLTINNADPSRRLAIADSSHSNGADVIAIGILPGAVSDTHTGAFGTNRIVSDTSVGDVGDSDNDIAFNFRVSPSAVLDFGIITQITQDNRGGTGSTQFEFQALSGDSGSPVFVENEAGAFEFGGLLHSVLNTTDGNAFSAFSDIGNPAVTHRQQILDLVTAEFSTDGDEFSIAGDVNLDGATNLDDLIALAEGFNDEATEASINTYVRGDLNLDGEIDLRDFGLLRQALGGSVSLVELNTALNAVGVAPLIAVPEPAAALLLGIGGGLLVAGRRRR